MNRSQFRQEVEKVLARHNVGPDRGVYNNKYPQSRSLKFVGVQLEPAKRASLQRALRRKFPSAEVRTSNPLRSFGRHYNGTIINVLHSDIG